MQKDYYSILNIDRESSQGDIKKAYRRLALVMFPQKFHPDKNSREDTTAEFQKISEAYCSNTNLGVTPPGQWADGGKAIDPESTENRDGTEPEPDSATPLATFIPEEPPPSLDAIRKRSEQLNTLLSEVIGELELRLRMRQELEHFPELEEFANKHLSLRCNVLVCGLCRRDLAVEPRWHFESVHYDEFLYWLDIKAKFAGAPSILCKAFQIKSFSIFQRGTVKEFCVFIARTAATRTDAGTKCTVAQEQFMAHCYHMSDGMVATAITDSEYPGRAAFFVLKQAIQMLRTTYGEEWQSETLKKDKEFRLPELKRLLQEHQDPRSFDPLIRAASATDEVIEVMNANMQLALSRSDQLDELIGKSEDLSRRAKLFYKESKSKRCCVIM